jgi:hypothetical protein
MDNKERIRERVLKNLAESKKAREASRMGIKTPDYGETRFTSKNFKKWEEQALLKEREKALAKEGKTLTAKDRLECRKQGEKNAWKHMRSFNKWALDQREIDARREVARKKGLPEPKEKATKDLSKSTEVFISHSDPSKDRGYVTGTKGRNRPSGKYVALRRPKSSWGEKNGLALPAHNKANETREVRISGDKLRGVTAAQPEWGKEAAARGDHVPRNGGKQQFYVQRGFAPHGNRADERKKSPTEREKNPAVRTVRGSKTDLPEKVRTSTKSKATVKKTENAPAQKTAPKTEQTQKVQQKRGRHR